MKYLGLPWINRAEVEPNLVNGFDCVSLIQAIYADQLDIRIPEIIVDGSSTRAVLSAFANSEYYRDWQQVDKPQNFDIIIFNIRNRLNHVGLVLNGGVIHSVKGQGVIYSLDTKTMGFQIDSVWRYQQ